MSKPLLLYFLVRMSYNHDKFVDKLKPINSLVVLRKLECRFKAMLQLIFGSQDAIL